MTNKRPWAGALLDVVSVGCSSAPVSGGGAGRPTSGGRLDGEAHAVSGYYAVIARLDEERQLVGQSSTRLLGTAEVFAEARGDDGTASAELVIQPCSIQHRVRANVEEAAGWVAATTIETLTGHDPSNLQVRTVPFNDRFLGLLEPTTVTGEITAVDGSWELATNGTSIRLGLDSNGSPVDDDGDQAPGVQFWVDGPGPANVYADVAGSFDFSVRVRGDGEVLETTDDDAEEWQMSLQLLGADATFDLTGYAQAFWDARVIRRTRALRLVRLGDARPAGEACGDTLSAAGFDYDVQI